MERRFLCTVCGRCCSGWLPLTLEEALAHAGRFPLAMVWTPVRPGAKAYELTCRIGTILALDKRRQVALRLVPTAYVPPALSCPALDADGRCSIHADKPLRCRTMPFFPYREEDDQADTLVPRKSWLCETGEAAPVVYRDKVITDRADFDRERQALLDQAPLLRRYADWLISALPPVREQVIKLALKPAGGSLVLDFASLLPRLPKLDVADFARRQLPVLRAWAAATAGKPELAGYHQHYRQWTKEMARLAGGEPA
jgi:Fe-S-cluster containining protein